MLNEGPLKTACGGWEDDSISNELVTQVLVSEFRPFVHLKSQT